MDHVQEVFPQVEVCNGVGVPLSLPHKKTCFFKAVVAVLTSAVVCFPMRTDGGFLFTIWSRSAWELPKNHSPQHFKCNWNALESFIHPHNHLETAQ